MELSEVLLDALTRVHDTVHESVAGLTERELTYRPDPDANTIAWLVWHVARIQDDHVSELAVVEQAWTADGWAARFELPFVTTATGYGHSSADVAAVRLDERQLLGYFDAVYARTRAYLPTLSPADLDRVVDERWDPPVTLGVRLVSVLSDNLQHAGQAAYIRGITERNPA